MSVDCHVCSFGMVSTCNQKIRPRKYIENGQLLTYNNEMLGLFEDLEKRESID